MNSPIGKSNFGLWPNILGLNNVGLQGSQNYFFSNMSSSYFSPKRGRNRVNVKERSLPRLICPCHGTCPFDNIRGIKTLEDTNNTPDDAYTPVVHHGGTFSTTLHFLPPFAFCIPQIIIRLKLMTNRQIMPRKEAWVWINLAEFARFFICCAKRAK